jgi:hypothetical protein|tara:strand:- start:174 stop:629 length:456 start_codon:yes stop_codon:yes gene_type:complete
MPTINQSIETSIGGKRYSADNSFTGSHISTIDTTFTAASGGGNRTLPIYAENNTNGDIKFIAFKSSKALDVFQLKDAAGSNLVLDLLATIPDSTIVANKTYQIPGSADLPTITQLTDVEQLVYSLVSTAEEEISIELSILFDTAITGDAIG